MRSGSRLPVFDGNKVTVLPEYDEAIARIVTDIKRAKSFIHMEYFIIALGGVTEPVFDALAAAVKRGVIVHVLYDSLSTKRYPNNKQMVQRLKAGGIRSCNSHAEPSVMETPKPSIVWKRSLSFTVIVSGDALLACVKAIEGRASRALERSGVD